MSRITITAVVFRENRLLGCTVPRIQLRWLRRKPGRAANELLRQIMVQVEADLEAGKPPFFGFKPAPKKYWDLFEEVKTNTRPIRPRKSLRQRLRELREAARVDAHLFPVVAAAWSFWRWIQSEGGIWA
jgi:hypothetical protein